RVQAEVVDDHARALAGEIQRVLAAEAAAGACDDCGTSFKLHRFPRQEKQGAGARKARFFPRAAEGLEEWQGVAERCLRAFGACPHPRPPPVKGAMPRKRGKEPGAKSGEREAGLGYAGRRSARL